MRLYTINQALFAVVLTIAIIFGVKSATEAFFPEKKTRVTPYMEQLLAERAATQPAPSPAGDGVEPNAASALPDAAADAAAPQVSFSTLIAAADPAAGERQAAICKACHSFDKSGQALVGPNLWGVVGRSKASASGYDYSPALSGLGGAWTYDDLDDFLKNPAAFAKGTKMTFAGVPKPEQRAAIIAYLRLQADSPAPPPGD